MPIRAHAVFPALLEPAGDAPDIDSAPDVAADEGRAETERLERVPPREPWAGGALEAPLARAAAGAGFLVGQCTAARHPTLSGRVCVRFASASGAPGESWLPTLRGLAVREHDRVLISQPGNWHEPMVLGVIDGLAEDPSAARQPPRALELPARQSLTIVDGAGTPLIEVVQDEGGPTLRVLSSDVGIDVAGKLRLSAESIELRAHAGSATVLATEDVVIRGEKVRLN